jgi:dTDP-4-dehydrorhamnose reductase
LSYNIIKLIKSDCSEFGVYHYSDDAEISWYDFAVEIYIQASARGLCPGSVKLNPIPTAEYPTPAKRPANSRMDKTKVKGIGFYIVEWKESLKKYFDKLETIS